MAKRVTQPAPSTDRLHQCDGASQNVYGTLARPASRGGPGALGRAESIRERLIFGNNFSVVPRSNWPVHEPSASLLVVTLSRNAP